MNCQGRITTSVIGTVIACSFAWVLYLSGDRSEVRADEPGFVKTKPASGPSVAIDSVFMVPYTVKIPGTEIAFEMIPVPEGSS